MVSLIKANAKKEPVKENGKTESIVFSKMLILRTKM